MAFDCLRKSIESWVGTDFFYSSYNEPTLFQNLTKEVFSVQGAWHSLNMVLLWLTD
jgi:hypothetical protein